MVKIVFGMRVPTSAEIQSAENSRKPLETTVNMQQGLKGPQRIDYTVRRQALELIINEFPLLNGGHIHFIPNSDTGQPDVLYSGQCGYVVLSSGGKIY